MRSIFLLSHAIEEREDSLKIIGMFSTREMALAAKQAAIKLEGFKEYPEGFFIDKYTLDKSGWTSGF
jgi:hypothetical protein